jgi:Icc-related predicted phosphoesterase
MDVRLPVRVAAVGDLHCTRTSQRAFQPLFAAARANANVLLLCGDLTDYGLPEEARVLARDLATVLRIPAVGVLGNHDYESGQHEVVVQILREVGVVILDGDGCEVAGLGIGGVKVLGGGFGERALQPWGEDIMKRFVREPVDEVLKFESALARLRTLRRVAILHYSPIQATVEGEPPELCPLPGSSRLEEPLNRYPVDLVFHGHAHHGQAEARTRTGVPVYNVCLPLLRDLDPDRSPVRIVELPAAAAPEGKTGGPGLGPSASARVIRTGLARPGPRRTPP